MAITYSRTYRNGTKYYDLNLESANVANSNAVTSYVSASASIDFGDWYYWGVGARIYINGSYVGGADGYTTGSGQYCAQCSGGISLPRRESAYNVSVYLASVSVTVSGYGGVSETTDLSYTVTVPAADTPSAPTNLSYTRASDNRVNLAWTASGSYKTAVLIERKTDGGSWSQVASLSADATSWSDETTSSDHSYQYRIRVTNGVKYSSYATSATTIIMTPAAPTSISLARASSTGTDVAVTLTNASNTATSLVWEKRASDSSTWETGGTISGKVTSFTATSLGGVYYVRVKNSNDTGSSAWLVSESITTICPPNPPTLLNPSGVVNMSNGTISFSWLHNTIDGSAQTAAQLQYKVGDGSWTTVSLTTEQTYSLAATTFSVGDSVTWQVKTRGVDTSGGTGSDGYSAWSSTKQFYVYQVPSLTFVANKPPETVTAMPIPCQVTYSDPQSMACASADVSLYDGDTLMFTEAMDISGNTLTASLTVAEFLPENGKTYTVVVTARSGSTLQSTANATFTVSYTPPKAATVSIGNDADTGYATLLIQDVSGSTGAAISTIEVYRVTDHRKLLVSGASVGQSFVDRYAPLNTAYTYEVVTYAESGALLSTSVSNTISTRRWFAYWGTNIAYAIWNPEEGGIELSRPERVHVRYSGRRDPVSYDGSAFGESRSMAFTVIDAERIPAFRQLMEDGGRGIFKSCDGQVMHADFDVTLNPALTERAQYGAIDVGITRIAGDEL